VVKQFLSLCVFVYFPPGVFSSSVGGRRRAAGMRFFCQGEGGAVVRFLAALVVVLCWGHGVLAWGILSGRNNDVVEAVEVPATFSVRGADPKTYPRYFRAQQAGEFSCFFEGVMAATRVPFDRINDGYCDCDDGSDEPGTSACGVNGVFFCGNQGGTKESEQTIPAAMVEDGVCDCCDGSDEPAGACPKAVTCKKRSLELRRRIKKEAKLHAKGAKAAKPQGSPKQRKAAFAEFQQTSMARFEADEQEKLKEYERVRAYLQDAQTNKVSISLPPAPLYLCVRTV
jgi:hypothetical protein